MPLFFNKSVVFSIFYIFLTLTITFIVNSFLQSFIHVPRRLDTKRARTYIAVVRSVISIVMFGIALYIIFIIIGIPIIPLLGSAGIIGLAIGIGARPFIEDIISGFFLLAQADIAIGDYVNVGSGIEGEIEDIGFRVLTIRGADGSLQIIPNGQVRQVINYSKGDAVVFVDIPVKTGQDVDAIIKSLEKVLQSFISEKEYHMHPGSEVLGVQNIQIGNGTIIRVQIVTTSSRRQTIDKEYRYRVIKEFEKHKILFA